MMDIIKEANLITKQALSTKCLSLFSEARIFGIQKTRRLVLFFKNEAGLIFFKKDKEAFLKRLRIQYKKNKEFYMQNDFIFYQVEAKSVKEIKHRDEESERILEKGIEKLSLIIEKQGERKNNAIPA
ncbi:hypothetical protein J0E39_001222 [Campylobacter upsaliensis]|nr:hypothetical protein [Campylobacter upsaliensis]